MVSNSTKQLAWIAIGIVLLLTSLVSIVIGEMCPARYGGCEQNLKIGDGMFWFFIFSHLALAVYLISLGCKGILDDGKSSLEKRKLKELRFRINPLVSKFEKGNSAGADGLTGSKKTAKEYSIKLYGLLERGEINEDEYRRLLYDYHRV